jgi:hypothetical protein
MHVALRGQTGTDVNELADTLLGKVAHRALHELAVLPARRNAIGDEPHELVGCRPVSREVIFPAE